MAELIGLIVGVVGGIGAIASVSLLLFALRRLPTSHLETWLGALKRIEDLELRQADLHERFTVYIRRERIARARESRIEQDSNIADAIAKTAQILGTAPVPPAPAPAEEEAPRGIAKGKLKLYRQAFPGGAYQHLIPERSENQT